VAETMQEHMMLYNALRSPPAEALKTIQAGRMKGKTDINPMWRIQALTSQFGPCGIGWKYEITRQWMEPGASGETSAFCNIQLYYRWKGEWSEGVPGTGGSAFVAREKNGLYTNDECYKMALTDAISVAAKALGVAGDVYWGTDPTKYVGGNRQNSQDHSPALCASCGHPIRDGVKKDGSPWSAEEILAYSTRAFSQPLCPGCQRKVYDANQAKRQAYPRETGREQGGNIW